MSMFIAAAEPGMSATNLAVAGLVGGLALAVAWVAGLLWPSRMAAGPRVDAGRPLAPLAGVMFAALVVWMVGPSLFVRAGPLEPGQPVTATGPTHVVHASLRQMVILNATIPVGAFIVLAVGDALVRPRVGQRLGFGPPALPRGVLAGLIGIAVTLPLVYCTMVVAEAVYRWVNYQHPSEHELLRAMGEASDPVVKYLAILAAVLVAPLWEELLFRGHIQTLIREGLIRIGDAGRAPVSTADVPVRPGETLEYFARSQADAPVGGFVARPRPVESWLAVLMSSLLFAGVHQPWTFPPIFCLSVCLGFAYERTGNLWAPVVMHSGFNALMTSYFLLGPASN